MAIWASNTVDGWAKHYDVHPNFMFLALTRWYEQTKQNTPTDDTYTVNNLGAFTDFVKKQQDEFISIKEVAETYKHQVTLNLLYAVLTHWRSAYRNMTTGQHKWYLYKTNYINDPEHNFYFYKETLHDFINEYCSETLTTRQLSFYSGKSIDNFWSKKYDALPENLRSRWFVENGPHKKYFRSIHFDELMHYFSLRGQKRKQEYAATLDAISPASESAYVLGYYDNKELSNQLSGIKSEKSLLKERIAELEKKEQYILGAMRKNNLHIK